MEDRSALFNQLKNFSQRGLKKVETKVVTSSGEQLVEKRGAKGLQVLTSSEGAKNQETEPARKLDLQVGLVLPGFLIGKYLLKKISKIQLLHLQKPNKISNLSSIA